MSVKPALRTIARQLGMSSKEGAGAPALKFILFASFIDMFSIGLTSPTMPLLIGEFTASFSNQAFWYGVVVFTYSVANFIAAPILGALSDRYGRRPILLLAFCGMASSMFVTATTTDLRILILIRLASGASIANVAVANAYASDVTSNEARALAFGRLSAILGLGYIFGTAFGGLVGELNIRAPFLLGGGLAVLNFLYVYFVAPESLPNDRRRDLSWSSLSPLGALFRLGNLKGTQLLVLIAAIGRLVVGIVQYMWVLYLSFRFGWGPQQSGWSLFALGMISMLAQGVLLRHLLGWLGAPLLATIGLGSSAVFFFSIGLIQSGWQVYALIPCNILGFAAAPTIQSMIVASTSEQAHGQTLGAITSLTSLAGIVAPIIGSSLLGSIATMPQDNWRVGTPFFFCAAVQVITAVLAMYYYARTKVSQTTTRQA